MFKDLCESIYKNKNLLMLFTVGIYICGLFCSLSGNVITFSLILTIMAIHAILKGTFPIKIVLIWMLVFYFGMINTSLRLKDSDELLSIAPINATIYGKIISVPQTKDNNKTKFFFNLSKIEYDEISKNFNNEKILVSLNTDKKLKIYDSYKIRGRLSVPFKAGNPSQFDYGSYLRNYDTYAVFYGKNPYSMKDLNIPCFEIINVTKSNRELILQKINNYREDVIKIHSKYLNSPNLEILGGIVFGDDAVSPPENIKQSFINSGLLHILAASGMNVAFIYSFFFFFLSLFKIPFRINIVICMAAVITYVFMTGLGASVVRAALMLIFVLVGKLIDRDAHNISLLSFVAFLMLIYNPMLINDVGFQLSFVVTFGLLIMTPYMIKSKNRFLNWIKGTLCVPIIAQLWVIPIQIFYFNNISLYSVFANIMSVTLVSVVSFGGFISSLLAIITSGININISQFICKSFDFYLNPIISLLVNISDFWGNLPHASLQTTHPNVIQLLLYYLILVSLTGLIDKEIRTKYKNVLTIALTLFTTLLLASTISIPNKNLEITAFDVGNADAFMIKTPDNKYFMVDTGKSGYNGGKSQAEIIILKYFKDKGIKNLNSLILTHFDNDHCGGAIDIINTLKPQNIYVNSLSHNSRAANEIYKSANNNNLKLIKAENNQIVQDTDGLKIVNFISNGIPGVGDNESSIITLISYKNFSMLFTGDAGIETLNNLKELIPKDITILKVGHHGAPDVINKYWAKYLNPKYSIVSTGENKFGHPSMYTLETLRNSVILRTDINNSVKIVVKKNKIKVLTYNPIKRKYTHFK
ncbi:DNA internalization-related competence protein ComEC/Rec2 [bacterium]|nr:DNA internalization-related competence protein ComEC/Rec2 [bacterium]